MISWQSIFRQLLRQHLLGVSGALLLIGMGVFSLVDAGLSLLGVHPANYHVTLYWLMLILANLALLVGANVLFKIIRFARQTLEERLAARLPYVR